MNSTNRNKNILEKEFQLRMKYIALLLSLYISACGDMCGHTTLNTATSPNGKLKAVSYLYDCGATTGFSTQVSILKSDQSVQTSGNIFIAKGKHHYGLRWKSDNQLLIGGTSDLETFKKELYFNDVTIFY